MNLVFLATCAMVTLLLSSEPAAATDTGSLFTELETIKQSTSRSMPGAWVVGYDDSYRGTVAKLVETAVAQARSTTNGSAQLTQHRDIIEVYSQLVSGMNFCVRFSASGNCANYHCKSYECVAVGHQPLNSRPNELASVQVECQSFTECDIDEIRENSKNMQLMGGWRNASLDHERVLKLAESSSRIATVQHGSVVEAYYQVVAGQNYCIRFEGQASGNCGNNCKLLTCVAGGFYPLPSGDLKSNVATKVGVNCLPDSHRAIHGKFGSSGDSSSGRHLSATILTIVVAIFSSFMSG